MILGGIAGFYDKSLKELPVFQSNSIILHPHQGMCTGFK
jgi:hypothetical protein